jgi:hypothetical protein
LPDESRAIVGKDPENYNYQKMGKKTQFHLLPPADQRVPFG